MFSILPRNPLGRDITLVVIFKIALIIVASVWLFPHDRRPVVTPDVVAEKFFGSGVASNIPRVSP